MVFLLVENSTLAQRPRFTPPAPLPSGVPGRQAAFQQPVVMNPGFGQPIVGQPTFGQPLVVQGPAYDPFAIQGQGFSGTPGVVQGGVIPGGVIQGGVIPGVTPGYPGGIPQQAAPYIYPAPNSQSLYSTGPYIPITLPGTAQPSLGVGGGIYAPGTVHPPYNSYGNSGAWPSTTSAWPTQVWARLRAYGITRLFERPRFRYSYIGSGNQISDLGIHDAELATTVSIPNFLWTTQPIRISPGFIFHYWDGPKFPGLFFDMPPRAFSTYLAFDYSTSWERRVGGEINLTVGLYTDFKQVTSDSIRITGVGLGWFRLTPNSTLKFGVEYIDRLAIKLFPAGGLFIQPTPDIKLNLYFPRPKIATRLPNFSNYEVWAYAGAEYGGGSWTVKRAAGFGDQVEINDIRTFIGFEWLGPRGVTGFFEGGYVFERELVFRAFPNFNVDLSDSYMLRAGIAY